MNVLDPIVAQIVNLSTEPKIFYRPMSKEARQVLNKVFSWGAQWIGSHRFGGAAKVMAEVSKVYDPLIYEQAIQKFLNFSNKIINKTPSSIKRISDGIDILMLKPLDSRNWIEENKIKENVNKVGLISLDKPAAAYSWLTTNFLLADFSAFDLNKISEMGMSFSLDFIKTEASNIEDIEKRTISYLYAILQSKAQIQDIRKQQQAVKDDEYTHKLIGLIKNDLDGKNKKSHVYDRDSPSKWARDREFIDIIRKLYK